MKIKRLKNLIVENWQPIVIGIVVMSVLSFLLLFRLGASLPGLSKPEVAFKAQTVSVREIARHPESGAYKVAGYGLIKIDRASSRNVRGISVAFGLAAIFLFYYTASVWYTRKTAVLATAMFASSAWFLHSARLAVPSIMLVTGVLAIIAYGTWFKITPRRNLAVLAGSLLVIYLLYVPGLIWAAIAGLIWQRKFIFENIRKSNIFTGLLAFLIFAAGLVPLVWAGLKDVNTLKVIGGFGTIGSLTVKEAGLNILRIPSQLVWRGPNNPVIWLGRVPLLDIFTIAMAAIGVYTYWFRRLLDRTKVLLGLILLTVALVVVNGTSYMVMLLPIVYLLAACGIDLLLTQWFKVFPRNPFAKALALGLITVAVFLSIFYNINHYFIGWPNAPETRAAFQEPS